MSVTSFGPIDSAQFDADRDLESMRLLASRLWPLGPHPGGLTWEWAINQLADEIVVFRGPASVVGWAAVDGSGQAKAQAEPGSSAALAAVAEWLKMSAGHRGLHIQASHNDRPLIQSLEAVGFEAGSDPWLGMWRDATPEQAHASAYLIRAVKPTELSERVDVHRAAWLPAELPYSLGHRPNFAAGATSRFTTAMYARLRDDPFYDPNLDLVAVAPDGSLAGCCIAWLDHATGVAEIEPMGVHPTHRRKGLAVAMCLEVSRRVAERGGRELFINTGPDDAYPAPAAAYERAGFRTIDRGRTYLLRRRIVGGAASEGGHP